MADTKPSNEAPDPVRAVMKTGIEQAKRAFDAFIASTEQALAGLDASQTAKPEGLRTLNEKIAAFTKANAEANFRFALKLADARQPNDVIALQNAHVQDQMETYTRQLEELRALTTRALKETGGGSGSTSSGA